MGEPIRPPGAALFHLIEKQKAYYRARATEYDEWFGRQGRYDRGPEENAEWNREVAALRRAVWSSGLSGSVLEMACGTGLWTELLTQLADEVTAVDSSEEMIGLNAGRLGLAPLFEVDEQRRHPDDEPMQAGACQVNYLIADLFNWLPGRSFDSVFFGFWLSHVPPKLRDGFWSMVEAAIVPGGTLCFVDSLPDPSSTATDHRLGPVADVTQERKLNDGRRFTIVKIFDSPDDLAATLRARGWQATAGTTGRFFYYVVAQRRPMGA
ncbi:MAG TPA: class I SAM-dependent methyltransferase [Armatimonadota bacterium]|jgi:demethylmenaquinone methyltransferase/2-methoxy-6-polyprenyl-1,4-benzoquinol methylase